MKNLFKRGNVLAATTMLAAALVCGCGNSDNFVFTNTNINPNPVQAPVAANDSFAALGNATVNQAASGVLANDTVNGATIATFDATGSQGGTIDLNADGSFSYTPLTGFVGAETFTYTLENAAGTSTATVTMTSTGFGRFVNNAAAPGGTGTQVSPFDTLADALAAAQPGDTIYVARGNGTNTGMTGGFTLPNGVNLIGEGTGLILGQTVEQPGTAPTLEGPVVCLGDNLIQGVTLDGGTAELIQIANVANVTINRCTLSNPDSADHINVVNISGTLSITNNTLQNPVDEGFDWIEIDNSSTNATVAVTDNTFLNPANADTDDILDIDNEGTTTMSVDFSRNRAEGTVANQFDYGLYWSEGDDETGLTSTLTCNDNVLTNFESEPIGAYNLTAGTISGNTLTNIRNAIDTTVNNGTFNIFGNVITNADSGLDLDFSANGANGIYIVTNNTINGLLDDGIYVSDQANNNAKIALRNNTITNATNEAIDIDWDATSNICVEVVGNTVNRNMLFDSDGGGTMNIERRDQLGTINTVNAPGMVDIQDGTANVSQGFCAIP